VANDVEGLAPKTQEMYKHYLGIAEIFDESVDVSDSREANKGRIVEPSAIPLVASQQSAYAEKVEKISAIFQIC